MKPPTYAPAYCVLFPMLSEVARKHGYALAIHGTVQRDMDLIAVPWIEDCSDASVLIEAIVKACDGKQPMAGRFSVEKNDFESVDMREPEMKPHGRLVWTIILEGNAFIDIGVMPRSGDNIAL